MGAEDDRGAGRHLVKFFDEDRTLGLQVVDDEGVVHDFMAHIDRRAEFFQRAFDDGDGAVDAGAESARIGEKDGGVCMGWYSRVTGCGRFPLRIRSHRSASGWLKSTLHASSPDSRMWPAMVCPLGMDEFDQLVHFENHVRRASRFCRQGLDQFGLLAPKACQGSSRNTWRSPAAGRSAIVPASAPGCHRRASGLGFRLVEVGDDVVAAAQPYGITQW